MTNAAANLFVYKHLPWDKGKMVARSPAPPKHVWSIRTKLQA